MKSQDAKLQLNRNGFSLLLKCCRKNGADVTCGRLLQSHKS